MEQFLLHNGEFYPTGIPVLRAENRAFKYGDAVFESIHASGRKLQFADEHLIRLMKACEILRYELPMTISSVQGLSEQAEKLLHRNRLFQGAKVRLTVYRTEGGLFAPKSVSTEWLLEAEPLDTDAYTLNSKGLIVGLYPDVRKNFNKLSFFKSASSLLNVTAGIFKNDNNLDDVLLLNNHNFIVEAMSSNIFLLRNNLLLTPALDQGCIDGIMRKQIIKIAIEKGFKVYDNCAIEPDDLVKAEEVFLTNSINGIRWVSGFEKKRFFSKAAQFFTTELNKRFINE